MLARSLLACGLTILFLSACDRAQQPQANAPPAPNVVIAQPVVEKLQPYDQFVGTAAAVESVDVRSRIAGYLIQIKFADGQLVKQGDLLFQIDPAPYEVDLQRGEMQLAASQGLFDVNDQQVQRLSALVKENAASPVELDRAIASREQARAQIAAARSVIADAKLNLSYAAIHAPIPGRISAPNLTVGNLVSSDALLTRLVRAQPIYVYFNIDERSMQFYRDQLQRSGLTLEQAFESNVEVLLSRGSDQGYPLKARLDFVDNQLDPQTNTIRTRAVFPNDPPQLAAGEFVSIRVPRGRPADALLVPEQAIGRDQDRSYLLIVNADSKVERRDVQLGHLEAGRRQILSGLQPGEWFIVEGLQRARPGRPVTAQKQPAQPPTTQSASARH